MQHPYHPEISWEMPVSPAVKPDEMAFVGLGLAIVATSWPRHLPLRQRAHESTVTSSHSGASLRAKRRKHCTFRRSKAYPVAIALRVSTHDDAIPILQEGT